MTVFLELSVMARGIISLWFMLLFLIACITAFRLLAQKSYLMTIPAILAASFSYYLVQWCCNISKRVVYYFQTAKVPALFAELGWLWLLGIGVLLTILNIALFLRSEMWDRTHVNAASLKEGIDDLPAGLCWYSEDGTPILRNRVMERICYQITGNDMYDAALLEAELRSRMDESNVMTLEDGSVWNLLFHTLQDGNAELHEICAYDITEEYKATRLLLEKQKELQLTGEKLIGYNHEMAQLIIAEEILAAKVRIHDELGQGLLLTRKYLLRGGTEEERKKLLQALWKINTLMESSKNESEKSYFEVILEAAADMGVTLLIHGIMPENQAISDIITTAMHENLTNTIRHAQGDEMQVEIREDNNLCTAVFTNSGRIPEGPIEERGGIATLRTLVESSGGEMRIDHAPRFRMTLQFKVNGETE